MDASAFLDGFITESLDHVDSFERALLLMRHGDGQAEHVDDAFRAVHSIKGSSGTFGLSHLGEFSHDVEETLDRLRAGSLRVTADLITSLLAAVDLLRELLSAAARGEDLEIAECRAVLEAIRGAADGTPAETETPTGEHWRIRVAPADHALLLVEPLTVFAGLASLGALEASASGEVPSLGELDVDRCYLSWDLTLRGGDGEQVREWLTWFEDSAEVGVGQASPVPDRSAGQRGVGVAASEVRSHQSRSIRVDVDKVDVLMNMLGELVIGQAMIRDLVLDFTPAKMDALADAIEGLEQETRALQDAVMRLRMLPASVLLQRLPRLVDDLCASLGKEVDLVIEGERTEIDKRVLESLTDPLTHMVRNSLDHGIESPSDRERRGKSRRGLLRVAAYHRGGFVHVELEDDGRGLDVERILASARAKGLVPGDGSPPADVADLIFAPGLSTAGQVSDVSGRGVGMDVVRRNIEALGGAIGVTTEPGEGCRFLIRLPLTLAIMDGQLARVGDEIYVIPVLSIVESVRTRDCQVRRLPSGLPLVQFRGADVPVLEVREVLGVPESKRPAGELLVVVEGDRGPVALAVDELQGQQQVVLKSLKQNYGVVPGISAATILGNGDVSMILDVHSLAQLSRVRVASNATGATPDSVH